MSSSINWSRPDLAISLMQQAYASQVHITKGNKDDLWRQQALILNAGKFAEFRAVDGPAYRKKYNAILTATKKKYAIDKPGANLSGLPEDPPELDFWALKILKDIAEKKVNMVYSIRFRGTLYYCILIG